MSYLYKTFSTRESVSKAAQTSAEVIFRQFSFYSNNNNINNNVKRREYWWQNHDGHFFSIEFLKTLNVAIHYVMKEKNITYMTL